MMFASNISSDANHVAITFWRGISSGIAAFRRKDSRGLKKGGMITGARLTNVVGFKPCFTA